jgi:sulfofructose kinase
MKIICVGHAALDRIFTVDSWPVDSAKIAASAFEETGGGMMANAAVAISRLGGEAVLWGPIGDDNVARIIDEQLQAEGVNTEHLRRMPGRTSSHSAVLLDARGERLVVGYRGDSLQCPADWLPLSEIATADAVMVDVRWPQGALAALRAARNAGKPAILDGEIAPLEVLEALSRNAEHVVFSQRGVANFHAADLESALRRTLANGARIAASTHGGDGVYWLERSQPQKLRHCPALKISPVDTLAAGDVFHGAYALAIGERRPVEEAMRFATFAAGLKCTRPGGRSGAPTRQEVAMLFEERTRAAL